MPQGTRGKGSQRMAQQLDQQGGNQMQNAGTEDAQRAHHPSETHCYIGLLEWMCILGR